MHLLNHGLSHYFSNVVHHHHLESSVLYHTSSLDAWPSELVNKPDRFVDKIESCSAHTMTPGHDGRPPVVDKEHNHTFLRVTLTPSEDHPEEVVFIERVLMQQGKATHSVIPVAADTAYPSPSADIDTTTSSDNGDTLYDHACVILQGSPSSLLHTHHVYVDRTVHFSGCIDRRLSLHELATLLRFISAQGLHAVSIGVDTACETYSKWFSRATLSALAPLIMRGAFRHLTPRPGLEAAQIEIAMQTSVNAWLASTFKEYPLEEVAAENLTRQLNAMNDEERAKKMEQIAQENAKKDKELMFKAMSEAGKRVRDAWELAQPREEGAAEGPRGQSNGMNKEKRTKRTRQFILSVDSLEFKAMLEAALEVRRTWRSKPAESMSTM